MQDIRIDVGVCTVFNITSVIRLTCKLQGVDCRIDACNLIKSSVCIAGSPCACIVADNILYLPYKIAVSKNRILHSAD